MKPPPGIATLPGAVHQTPCRLRGRGGTEKQQVHTQPKTKLARWSPQRESTVSWARLQIQEAGGIIFMIRPRLLYVQLDLPYRYFFGLDSGGTIPFARYYTTIC